MIEGVNSVSVKSVGVIQHVGKFEEDLKGNVVEVRVEPIMKF